MPRDGFWGGADVTSTEAHFSRSLKIRMGVADCLYMLANRAETGQGLPFEAIEDLGAFAANHIFESGWDLRPAASQTAARWIKQYILPNSFFELATLSSGGFVVQFRTSSSKQLVARLLEQHRPRKRKRRANVTAN